MLLFSIFLLLRQMDIKPGVPNQRAANMYVFFLMCFFIFLEVTSFKKSLGAGITDPAEKLKKIYMIIDHVSLSFRFTWWFIVFLSSQTSCRLDVGFLLCSHMMIDVAHTPFSRIILHQPWPKDDALISERRRNSERARQGEWVKFGQWAHWMPAFNLAKVGTHSGLFLFWSYHWSDHLNVSQGGSLQVD